VPVGVCSCASRVCTTPATPSGLSIAGIGKRFTICAPAALANDRSFRSAHIFCELEFSTDPPRRTAIDPLGAEACQKPGSCYGSNEPPSGSRIRPGRFVHSQNIANPKGILLPSNGGRSASTSNQAISMPLPYPATLLRVGHRGQGFEERQAQLSRSRSAEPCRLVSTAIGLGVEQRLVLYWDPVSRLSFSVSTGTRHLSQSGNAPQTRPSPMRSAPSPLIR
jgi:hypothetical protein